MSISLPGELIVGVQFAPVQIGGVREAASARVALRRGRRGGGARREGRRDSVGAHRAHRRDHARGSIEQCRESAGRQEGGWHCGRGVQRRPATSPT